MNLICLEHFNRLLSGKNAYSLSLHKALRDVVPAHSLASSQISLSAILPPHEHHMLHRVGPPQTFFR